MSVVSDAQAQKTRAPRAPAARHPGPVSGIVESRSPHRPHAHLAHGAVASSAVRLSAAPAWRYVGRSQRLGAARSVKVPPGAFMRADICEFRSGCFHRAGTGAQALRRGLHALERGLGLRSQARKIMPSPPAAGPSIWSARWVSCWMPAAACPMLWIAAIKALVVRRQQGIGPPLACSLVAIARLAR